VSVSKVGGIFVYKRKASRLVDKSTFRIRGTAMKKPLTDEQQAQAQTLVETLRPRLESALQQLAELLVAHHDAPFGQPEFQLRDLLHRLGADALQTALAEKKTAITAPV
jgi:hypothetical protein